MVNQRDYGRAIWTNHALARLGQRGLSQKLAWQAFQYPDRSLVGKEPGTTEFQKQFDGSLVTVIARQNDKQEWVILSCWIDPPLAGSIDILKKEESAKFQKASFWGKWWLTLKKQLGI